MENQMTDMKNYKVPAMFTGCDFGNTTMPDGTVLIAEGDPIVLERDNIIFPIDWTGGQKRAFRDRQS
jgi:hypothetical protein